MGVAYRHTLACAQVERDVGPPPVVDQQLHRDKSLSPRIGRNIGFRAVGRDSLAVFGSVAVLAAYAAAEHLFVAHGLDRVQNLGLLIAYRIRVERDRRFHGREANELHDVVGNHIAQRTRSIEITAPPFHTHGLRYRDLHVIDVAAVPDWLKNSVGETERHDVLDSFFAQIVIDAVDLLLVGLLQQLLVQRFRRLQIVPEGFLDNHTTPVTVGLFHQSGGGELLHDWTKKAWCRSEVVEHVLVGGMLLIHLVQKIFELRIKFVVAEIPGEVIEAAGKPLPQIIVHALPAVRFDVVVHTFSEFIVGVLGARDAYHGKKSTRL